MRRLLSSLAVAVGLAVCAVIGAPGQEPKPEAKEKPAPPAIDKAAAERLRAEERLRAAEAARQEAAKKARVEKAAVAARAAIVVGEGEDQFVKQWEQQLGPQFKQLLRGELHFMRLVTNLNKAQYEKIAADSEPIIKAAIRKYAMAMRQGGDQSDPQSGIVEAIAKSVEANLTPAQSTRYKLELKLRTEAKKRLAVLNLVAMTDKLLVLSPDQREKLSEILTSNWNDSWNQTQIFMYGGRYFPNMPDDLINPILTDLQRKVWSTVHKNQIRFGVNLGIARNNDLAEENWDEEPAGKKPNAPQ